MFESIIDDLKAYFRSGNMISRLIIINAVFFIALILIKIGLMFTGPDYPDKVQLLERYLSFHEDMRFNLRHPWVFVTHAFTHFGFFHILWNMLLLLWFGRIVGDLLGDKRVLPIYILGILGGLLFFWLSARFLLDGYNYAYGASAAVMAIIAAAGFTAPDYRMHLIIIGPVRIKYIVLVLVVLDLLAVSNQNNTGGSIAHLGGVVSGALFVYALRNGSDLSKPINNIIQTIQSWFTSRERNTERRRSPLKVSHKSWERSAKAGSKSDQGGPSQSSADRLDMILDKIKEKGINSLTKEEKEFLDSQSKEN